MHPSDFPEKPLPPNLDLPGIDQLVAIVAQLRSPVGCPWDREQTHASLRASLLEEAYEVLEAIDNRDEANLREELGDLLLQSVFHAQLASEEGRFTFDQVAREISAKLVRRHPHVFAGDHCEDSEAVLARWEEIKLAEKGGSVASLLDGIPRGFPGLLQAQKTQKKASKVGFDWKEIGPVFEKLDEEIAELKAAIACPVADAEVAAADLEDELGDILFTVVNLARKLNLDAEVAMQRSTRKFADRFRAVEKLAGVRGWELGKLDLVGLDALWDEVKREAESELGR